MTAHECARFEGPNVRQRDGPKMRTNDKLYDKNITIYNQKICLHTTTPSIEN